MSVIIVIGIVLAVIVGIVAVGFIGGTVVFFTVNFIFETWENIESAIAVRRIKRNKLRDIVDPAKLAADRASVRSRIDAL